MKDIVYIRRTPAGVAHSVSGPISKDEQPFELIELEVTIYQAEEYAADILRMANSRFTDLVVNPCGKSYLEVLERRIQIRECEQLFHLRCNILQAIEGVVSQVGLKLRLEAAQRINNVLSYMYANNEKVVLHTSTSSDISVQWVSPERLMESHKEVADLTKHIKIAKSDRMMKITVPVVLKDRNIYMQYDSSRDTRSEPDGNTIPL
jgi:hypothetical protein